MLYSKSPGLNAEGWNELEADTGVIGSDAEVDWDDTASDDEDLQQDKDCDDGDMRLE